jgi:hypothetical protein
VQQALANASRILPIVTTAYCPSAANNIYWPELYTNQSIVTVANSEPYTDTPAPKVFGNSSPLDPQLFARVNDYADQLLNGDRNGKYSPVEVAQWLEDYAAAAMSNLRKSETGNLLDRADYRRLHIDVAIQAGLGKFFGAKLRAAALYRIYEKTGNRMALEEAITKYREARAAWSALGERAKGIYVADITVGEHPQLRGHWLDRLPAIDEDLQNMSAKLSSAAAGDATPQVRAAVAEIASRPRRTPSALRHKPAASFKPGQPMEIEASLPETNATVVWLFYRRVDQAERWESIQMELRDGRYRATVPGSYTQSPFPMQYYFETHMPGQTPGLHPGFTTELNNQPYYILPQS